MSSSIRTQLSIDAIVESLGLGPWLFGYMATFDKSISSGITFGAGVNTQVLGGVAPQIAAITQASFLLIIIPVGRTVKVGLNGVNAQSEGTELGGTLMWTSTNITSLQIYNSDTLALSAFLSVGGS